MPAGTIALTNNSATLTGTGTSFTTELKVNDFVVSTVGGLAYTLGVKSIQSNTSLTLMEVYTGPSAAGQSWTPVPYGTMSAITAQVAAQVTYAIRGFNLDKANWQQIFTGTGTVTINLPDGTSWQGPAWGGITTTLNNKAAKGANSDITSLSGLTTAVTISQGGTGGKTAAEARSGIGLGTAATANVQTSQNDVTSGAVMTIGAFGLGNYGVPTDNANGGRINSILAATGAAASNYFDSYSALISLARNGSVASQIQPTTDAKIAVRGCNAGNWTPWYELYSTKNTTKASDGTLKAASPIARIVCSQGSSQRADVAESGFTWCGCGTANEEAEGIALSRLEAGIYVLTGSAGLATEGWQLLPPRDPKGSGDLGIVEAEQTESGGLKISLYKRRYKLTDNGDIEVVKGDLIDVPTNSWIDVRLDMPEDSAYNRKQAEMQISDVDDDHQSGS